MIMQKIGYVSKLENGVKVFRLTDFVQPNLEEADEIFEYGESVNAYKVNASSQYNERVGFHSVVATYEVQVSDDTEYERFWNQCVNAGQTDYLPSFQQWREGRVTLPDGRSMRLGKWMTRQGFDKSLIVFYSQQVKTSSKTLYLTISDMPQHIAGMTYYAKDWTSCQHPDRPESVCVAGSLHDDSLLIAFTHERLEDLEDMEGKMLARTLIRPFYERLAPEGLSEGAQAHFLPSRLYGTDETRTDLTACLRALREVAVHPPEAVRGVEDGDEQYMTKESNGYCEYDHCEEVYVKHENEHYVTVDCPHCEGNGYESVDVGFDLDGEDHEATIECTLCQGCGEIETVIFHEHSAYETVEYTEKIKTYDEYYHWGEGNHLMIMSSSYLEKWKQEYSENE